MIILVIDNSELRLQIETFTKQYCFPDIIRFLQDKEGSWFLVQSTIENPKFESIKAIILSNCRIKEYVPPINPEDNAIDTVT
jgi:hypothetical protein